MAVSFSCFVLLVAVFHLNNAAVTIINPPPVGATTQRCPTKFGRLYFLLIRIAENQLENNDIRT